MLTCIELTVTEIKRGNAPLYLLPTCSNCEHKSEETTGFLWCRRHGDVTYVNGYCDEHVETNG